MKFLALLLFALPAHAPIVEWRLEPAAWQEVNLCLEECELKARWVTKYEWRSI